MAFVVSPAARSVDPTDPSKFTVGWPIVFENPDSGINTGFIAKLNSRDASQKLADALNAALTAATAPPAPAPAPAAAPAK